MDLIRTRHTIDYEINPIHSLTDGAITSGYEILAGTLADKKVVLLEGYVGVNWEEVIHQLLSEFEANGVSVMIHDVSTYYKEPGDLELMIEPFLGGDDPIFGRKTSLSLNDFLDFNQPLKISLSQDVDLNIVFGSGSSLLGIEGFLVYFDVPKNELQYRMRSGEVKNLGMEKVKNPKQAYKHFYFVDWVVLNKEKKRLLPEVELFVDQQAPRMPTMATGDTVRNKLKDLSQSYFRAKPWFEPGVWGGQWIKSRIPDLNQNAPNYAWSFELIAPENGLLFKSDNNILEVSFDLIMFQEKENILGKAAQRFQDDFPIRFDFLDTVSGGNLSLQCHPSPDYIQKEFGEDFTQDETYYILDAEPDASVYLGFQEDINPDEFRNELEKSALKGHVFDVNKFIRNFPAKKHDLFLIPHGTIHCSGAGNMVLEISATPYIFTFKMYDWQRLDLDGKPRPINIDRAFKNLNFARKGKNVEDTLISKTSVKSSGSTWKILNLSTHPDHFYVIERYEFTDSITVKTNGQCHIMMLVEGAAVNLEVNTSEKSTFSYAETFIVPAAANSYTLTNQGSGIAKVIVAYVKDEAC